MKWVGKNFIELLIKSMNLYWLNSSKLLTRFSENQSMISHNRFAQQNIIMLLGRVKFIPATNWKRESRKEIWWTAVIDFQPSGEEERKSRRAITKLSKPPCGRWKKIVYSRINSFSVHGGAVFFRLPLFAGSISPRRVDVDVCLLVYNFSRRNAAATIPKQEKEPLVKCHSHLYLFCIPLRISFPFISLRTPALSLQLPLPLILLSLSFLCLAFLVPRAPCVV